MIILDTNVFSALMQEERRMEVVAWLDALDIKQVWTTAITVMEVRRGIEILATGRKQQLLDRAFNETLFVHLNGRVLDFDLPAAEKAATFLGWCRRAGRPVGLEDVQIAGIVAARNATLATRNVEDFADVLMVWQVVNPWDTSLDPSPSS